jgi:hypothetical protein
MKLIKFNFRQFTLGSQMSHKLWEIDAHQSHMIRKHLFSSQDYDYRINGKKVML